MEDDLIWFECECGFKGEIKKSQTWNCPECNKKSSAGSHLTLREL